MAFDLYETMFHLEDLGQALIRGLKVDDLPNVCQVVWLPVLVL